MHHIVGLRKRNRAINSHFKTFYGAINSQKGRQILYRIPGRGLQQSPGGLHHATPQCPPHAQSPGTGTPQLHFVLKGVKSGSKKKRKKNRKKEQNLEPYADLLEEQNYPI